MEGYKRIIVILTFFLLIILLLQLARMGVINNAKDYVNIIEPQPETISTALTIKNTDINFFIIFDNNSEGSIRCAENYESLFDKYKLNYKTYTSDDNIEFYDNLSGVILTFSDYNCFNSFDILFDYVNRGGAFITAVPCEDGKIYNSLAGTFGIMEHTTGGYSDYIIDKKGIVGSAGEKYPYTGKVLYSRKVRLRPDCEIYLENENNIPLLWKINFGKGLIYCVNSDVIQFPTGRGVVTELIYEITKKSILYPSYGIITLHLESFPGPSIRGNYKILRDSNKQYDGFIKDILWPDVIKISKRYGIKPTIVFVQSYSSETRYPFGVGELLSSTLMTYGIEALQNGGEISYHGYCYRPLGLKGELLEKGWFEPWSSYEDIQKSLKITQDFFNDGFPKYKLTTYFPPEGRMSQGVLHKCQDLMPDVKTICIPYHNSMGDQLYGDFKTDSNGIFFYSITSGVDGIRWNAKNSLRSLGIISQSVDIPYAIVSDKYNWFNISEDIENIIKEAYERLPYIKPMKVSDAANRIKLYENISFVYNEDNDGINVEINNFFKGISFLLRTSKIPTNSDEYEIFKADDGLYSIIPKKPCFKIIWGGS